MKVIIFALAVLCILGVRATEQAVSGPIACSFCMGVVKALEENVVRNETIGMLQGAAQKICDRLRLSSWCQTNIIPILPSLLTLIVNRRPPQEICARIKICDNMTITLSERPLQLQCSFCEAIVNQVKTTLAGQQGQAAVQKAIGDACNRLGAIAGGACQMLIKNYLTKLVDDLDHQVSTRQICVNTKMCKN